MAMANLPRLPSASQPYSATAWPIRAAVPIGARRITHHSTFCTMVRSEPENSMNGSAFGPTFTAAIPKTIAMTSSCRTLKFSDPETAPSVSLIFTPRPRKFCGTMLCRNPHHEPTESGSCAAEASTPELTPGLMTKPSTMAMTTDTKDVMANQTSVETASLAAPAT